MPEHNPKTHHPVPWSELHAWRTILHDVEAKIDEGDTDGAKARMADVTGVLDAYNLNNPVAKPKA